MRRRSLQRVRGDGELGASCARLAGLLTAAGTVKRLTWGKAPQGTNARWPLRPQLGKGDTCLLSGDASAVSGTPSSLRPKFPKYVVRIIAGFALGEIMGPATFAGGLPFLLAYCAVVSLISLEYNRILAKVLQPPTVVAQRWAMWVVCMGIMVAAHLRVLTGIFECAAVTLLMTLLVFQGNQRQEDGGVPIRFSHVSSQVFGVFYVGYLPSFWVRLRGVSLALEREPAAWFVSFLKLIHWPLRRTVGCCVTVSLVLCIIAADSCAYFGGRKFGKRPLILISPRKTQEGAYFGLLGAVAMGMLCDVAWGFPGNLVLSGLVGAMIFVASLLGDLVVSCMKRDAGLKDTGALIPGHGGLLDRFDSYFFACPVSYFCWYMALRVRGTPLSAAISAPFP